MFMQEKKNTFRTCRRLFVVALFLLPALHGCSSPQKKAPDIIFILIDDQRYDLLSSKDHPWIETPHIDRLAENGIYFDRAYVTTSLCSPSRASILTGQYAHSHRVLDNDTPLPREFTTFPEVLRSEGYTTGFVGKWHMGGDNDMPRSGFDYWASFRGQGPYFDPEMNINGERMPFEGYTPDILTDLSVAFIEEQQPEERPYFLYLSHKSIHGPFTPAPRHQGVYSNKEIPTPFPEDSMTGKPRWLLRQRRSWHGAERDTSTNDIGDYTKHFQKYSETMLAVDESVGEITAALSALDALDNTAIIYFSDNGYMMGEQGLIDKRVMHEPSIRVPAFVHWPAALGDPDERSEFILNVDLGPTILDLAGADVPESMHGRSFAPLLKGSVPDWRDAFVYEYFIDPNAVQTPTTFGLRTKDYSYMNYHGVWDVYELYDMRTDPEQTDNLLGHIEYGHDYGDFLRHVAQQDTALYRMVKRLDERLTELLRETGGSRTPDWRLNE